MNVSSFRPRLLGSSMLIAAAIALGATVPALADNSVVQSVTPGFRTASVANPTLTAIPYSHSQQVPTGSMTLTADDSTGSNTGWNVTISSSAFVWTAGSGGAASGTNIAASAFALTSDSVATQTAGQAVDTTAVTPGGPNAGAIGSLDTARKVLSANSTFGNGTYTQALGVSLTVPADSAAGTYTGTLTTSIGSTP